GRAVAMTACTRLLAVLVAVALTAACRSAADVEDPDIVMTVEDVHSYARAAEARVTHVSLDLAVDFQSRTLTGTAALEITRADEANALVLDTNDLRITGVTDESGNALPFSLGATDLLLGQALTIALGPSSRVVTVAYATSPDAAALQWLAPPQTAG